MGENGGTGELFLFKGKSKWAQANYLDLKGVIMLSSVLLEQLFACN